MGFPEKPQVEELEGKKWVIAGISMRSGLKPISIKPREKAEDEEEEEEEARATTPKTKEARIPEILTCPPAPRKRRPSSRCHFNGVIEFFTPPDLESVFIRQVERAS